MNVKLKRQDSRKKKRKSIQEAEKFQEVGHNRKGLSIGDHKVDSTRPNTLLGPPQNEEVGQKSKLMGQNSLLKGRWTPPSSPYAKKAAESVLQAMKEYDRSVSRQITQTSEARDRVQGFPTDCGLPGGLQYMSVAKALYERSAKHPHLRDATIEADLEDGLLPGKNFDPVPLSVNFGQYTWDWWLNFVEQKFPKYQKWLGACEDEDVFDLYQYGLGVPLYFKMLKFYAVVFFLLFFLTIPSLSLFSLGRGMTKVDRAIYRSQIAVNDFFYSTMGTFGEADYTCRREAEGASFDLACPKEAQTLVAINAFYGDPKGDCLCPVDQRVDHLGSCPTAAETTYYCPPQNISGLLLPSYCFRGEMPDTGAPCCATYLAPNKIEGDLRDLGLAANPECNLEGAQAAIEEYCLGEASCTIEVTDAFFEDHGATIWNGNACPAFKILTVVGTCYNPNIGATGTPKANVILAVSIMNCVIILLFGLASFWLYQQQFVQAEEVRKEVTDASEYSLMITNLPFYEEIEDLEQALLNYFAEYFELNDMAHMMPKIIELNFALPMKHEVDILRKRGKAALHIDEMEAHLELLLDTRERLDSEEICPGEKDDSQSVNSVASSIKGLEFQVVCDQITALQELLRSEYQKFEKNSEKLEEILEDRLAQKGITDLQHDPFESQTCFATFSTVEEKKHFRSCFRNLGACTSWLRPRHSDFNGSQLRVVDCDSPINILWENLSFSNWSKLTRQLSSTLLTFCVMALAFIFMYMVKKYHTALELNHPPNDCAGRTVIFDIEEGASIRSRQYITPQDVIKDFRWEYYGYDRGDSGKLECFCKQLYYEKGYDAMVNYAFTNDPTVDGASFLCSTWANDFSMANKSTMMGVFGVLFTNQLIDRILRGFIIPHEKLHSQKLQELSLLMKSFISQTINIAGIALVINGNLKYFDAKNNSWIFLKIDWTLFTGLYKDLGEGWFLDVGTTILINMLMNVFVQHFFPLAGFLYQKFQIWKDRNFNLNNLSCTKAASQHKLEELYLGPVMHFEERYAQILVHIFVTLIYCAGMPLLILLCSLNLFVQYHADKFLLLRYYRAPTMTDERLPQLTVRLVPIAIFLHCIVTMWMLTNGDVLLQEDEYGRSLEQYSDRILQAEQGINYYIARRFFSLNTIPQAAIFLIICCIFIFRIMRLFVKLFGCQRNSATCQSFLNIGLQKNEAKCHDSYFEVLPTYHLKSHIQLGVLKAEIIKQYQEELERRKQHGIEEENSSTKVMISLPSYNYVINPRYLKSYALDTKVIKDYNKAKFEQSRHLAKAKESATVTTAQGNQGVSKGVISALRNSIAKRQSQHSSAGSVRQAMVSPHYSPTGDDAQKFRPSFVMNLGCDVKR